MEVAAILVGGFVFGVVANIALGRVNSKKFVQIDLPLHGGNWWRDKLKKLSAQVPVNKFDIAHISSRNFLDNPDKQSDPPTVDWLKAIASTMVPSINWKFLRENEDYNKSFGHDIEKILKEFLRVYTTKEEIISCISNNIDRAIVLDKECIKNFALKNQLAFLTPIGILRMCMSEDKNYVAKLVELREIKVEQQKESKKSENSKEQQLFALQSRIYLPHGCDGDLDLAKLKKMAFKWFPNGSELPDVCWESLIRTASLVATNCQQLAQVVRSHLKHIENLSMKQNYPFTMILECIYSELSERNKIRQNLLTTKGNGEVETRKFWLPKGCGCEGDLTIEKLKKITLKLFPERNPSSTTEFFCHQMISTAADAQITTCEQLIEAIRKYFPEVLDEDQKIAKKKDNTKLYYGSFAMISRIISLAKADFDLHKSKVS